MSALPLQGWLGRPVRSIPGGEKTVYLTFDDGPDPTSTPAVIGLLANHGVPATFFVVSEKARQTPTLLAEMRKQGHAIGNHSLDHRYGAFFRGTRAMTDWIRAAEDELSALISEPTVGFRPPAGVRTPELGRALRELGLPLVLWNERFYDAVFKWDAAAARKSAARLGHGSIVLLHDRKPARDLPLFLETLGTYIDCLKERGFVFRPLSRKICEKSGSGA